MWGAAVADLRYQLFSGRTGSIGGFAWRDSWGLDGQLAEPFHCLIILRLSRPKVP